MRTNKPLVQYLTTYRFFTIKTFILCHAQTKPASFLKLPILLVYMLPLNYFLNLESKYSKKINQNKSHEMFIYYIIKKTLVKMVQKEVNEEIALQEEEDFDVDVLFDDLESTKPE